MNPAKRTGLVAISPLPPCHETRRSYRGPGDFGRSFCRPRPSADNKHRLVTEVGDSGPEPRPHCRLADDGAYNFQ